MSLYLPLALPTPFSRTFIIKGNANNGRNSPSCPFQVKGFINEETTSCINEEVIGAINEATVGGIIVP